MELWTEMIYDNGGCSKIEMSGMMVKLMISHACIP